MLRDAGFWTEAGRHVLPHAVRKLRDALFDYGNGWAVGAEPIGPHYWPDEIARRARSSPRWQTQSPQPALNAPPEVITEPFTIMLWGITTESVKRWLKAPANATS